jgi:excisionase family DNA binding protein
MEKQTTQPTAVQQAATLAQSQVLTENDLLTLFLASPGKQREEQFADTARVAEMTGLSRRTIQIWIDIGLLQAIRLGRKKYQISLASLRDCLRRQNHQ